MTKNKKELNILINYLIGGILVLGLLLKLITFISTLPNPDINSYSYTEYLINFEGGFVRRGLLGEILYKLTYYTNLDPIRIIQIICIITYILTGVFLFKSFSNNRYKWWILLSPLLLAFTNSIIRKDYLLYVIFIGIILAVRPRNNKNSSIIIAWILMILGLYVHETFIFWAIPVIIFILFQNNMLKGWNLVGFAMVLVSAFLLFYYKGTEYTAINIVQSWNDILSDSPLNYTDNNSIGALGWNAISTFKHHFKINFYLDGIGWWGFPIRILWWMIIYYFFTNFIFVFQEKEDTKIKKTNLSILYLINTICLLPMYLLLSCDWGRIYQYAVMGSLIPFLIFPTDYLKTSFSFKQRVYVERLNEAFEKIWVPNKITMVMLLLIIGVAPAGFSISSSLGQSPIGSILYFFIKN